MPDEEQPPTTNEISENEKISTEKPEGNAPVTGNEKNKSDEKSEPSTEKRVRPKPKFPIIRRRKKKYVVDEKQLTEQRINVKFLVKLKKTATESFALMTQAYGEQCMSRTRVFEWYKRFADGHEDVDEGAYDPENVNKIVEQVMADKKVRIRKLAKVADVNQATVKKIVNMMKVGDRLKLEEPKRQRKKRTKKKEDEDGSCPSVKPKKPRTQKKSNVVRNLEELTVPNKNECGNQAISEYLIMKSTDHQYSGNIKTNPYADNLKDNPYIGTLKDNTSIVKPNNNVYIGNLKDNSNSYTGNPTNNPYAGNPTNIPYAANPINNINNPYSRNPKEHLYPEKQNSNPYPGYPYHGTGYSHILYPGSSFS